MNSDQIVSQLDTDLLCGYIDTLGKNVVEQMFVLYKQQVVFYLNDIELALQANSQKLWQESCHKMKGAAASVGLSNLYQKLVVIEKCLADKEEKSKLLTILKQTNEQGISAFEYWLSQ